MSINQVILMGKITNKKETAGGGFSGVIETSFYSKDKEYPTYNFVSASGNIASLLHDVPIGYDVYIEGKLSTRKENDKYITEVIATHFDIPNDKRPV